MDELTEGEKELLVREVAADDFPDGYGKRAFLAGWNAAMEYVNARQVQQPERSDGSGRHTAGSDTGV